MKKIKDFIKVNFDNSFLGVITVNNEQLLISGNKTTYHDAQVWDVHFENSKYWSIYIPIIDLPECKLLEYFKEQVRIKNLQVGELAGFEY